MVTVTLRPNADGTYNTWSEIPNSGLLFSTQAEEGDFTPWTSSVTAGGGTVTISNTLKHHGDYSIKSTASGVSGDKGYAKKTITSSAIAYVRFYVYFSALNLSATKMLYIAQLDDNGTHGVNVRIINPGGAGMLWQLDIWEGVAETTVNGTHAPTTGQWYCVEILRDITNDVETLWIDGVQEATSATAITTNSSRLWVGITYTNENVNATTLYSDCVVVSTSAIGTEDRHALVDDDPADDTTGFRVTCFNAETVAYTARKTTYNLTNHAAETGVISNVTAYCRAKYSTGGGNEGFKLIWKLAATEVQSVEKTPGVAFGEFSDSRNTDPDGGAWSWDDVDSLEIGAVASTLAVTEAIDVSEFWIVVTYTEANNYSRLIAMPLGYWDKTAKGGAFTFARGIYDWTTLMDIVAWETGGLYTRTVADVMQLFDVLTHSEAWTYSRQFVDVANMFDVLTSSSAWVYVRAVNDMMAMWEAPTSVLAHRYSRIVNDVLDLWDVLSRSSAWVYSRSINDMAALWEGLTPSSAWVYARIANDMAQLFDVLTHAESFTLERTMHEYATLIDALSLSSAWVYSRSINDMAQFFDVLNQRYVVTYTRQSFEHVYLWDALERAVPISYAQHIADYALLVDYMTVVFSGGFFARLIHDTFMLIDGLTTGYETCLDYDYMVSVFDELAKLAGGKSIARELERRDP